jgi:hypothetical protein
MPTLAEVLRKTGYSQGGTLNAPAPLTPTLTSILSEHIKTLPQQIEANQRAMDKTTAGMDKYDIFGKPNPNYYPEAMKEFTQNYLPAFMGATAWHGTPHKILNKFDISKVGTGEGAQAYGHGIYVAENPLVAKDYQFMEQNWFDTSQATYKGKPINYWYEKAEKDKDLAYRTKNKALEKDATARAAYWENIMTHSHPEKVVKTMTDPDYGWDEAAKYAKSIDLTKFKGIPDAGNLYKVDLPDEKIATMLDWDLPLSKQSPQVQAAVEKLTGLKVDKAKMSEFDDALLDALQGGSTELPKQPLDPIGADLYAKFIGGGNEAAARKLQEAGVGGVKYLDQFSRPEGKGTRNFVLFPSEEKNLTILERNGLLADQFEALPVEKKKEILSLLE